MDLEILKFRIKYLGLSKGKDVNFFFGLNIAMACAVGWMLWKVFKKPSTCFLMVVIISMLVLMAFEVQLQVHKNFSKTVMSVDQAYQNAKHGDLLLFSYYEASDVPDLLFNIYKSLFQKRGFSHIGIVIETDQTLYLLESVSKARFSDAAGIKKNGLVVSNLLQRMESFPRGRIIIVPTNLAHWIHREKMLTWIHDHKFVPYSVFGRGFTCTKALYSFLESQNLVHVMKRPRFLLSCDLFLDAHMYTVPIVFGRPFAIQTF